ncbi:MAG: hypothetical protein FJ410_05015 [Verrucomicrobia bacterium]|nr:hypothetical protein [Verrucomicrobiota bacterium]
MSEPQDKTQEEPPVLTARARKGFWRRIGGEGLTVSLAVHLLLILLAAFWVVATVTTAAKRDPDSFATGAGGGNGGERNTKDRQKTKPRNVKAMTKSPTRITSKSATNPLAIAALPPTPMSPLTGGLLSSSGSKGFGGGAGGGIGAGMGAGRGGRNFVSMFGARGTGLNAGISGTLYDIKQDRAGKPTSAMGVMTKDHRDPVNQKPIAAYRKEVKEFLIDNNFNPTALNDRFRSPHTLYAQQIFIPPCLATEAPKAYGVEGKVKPSRWIAHYRGMVKVPRSGQFRFVGSGDDWMVIRFNGKVALDSGFEHPIVKNNVYPQFKGQQCDETHPSTLGRPMRCGPWIEITAGQEIPIDIVLGETPGGAFYAFLCIEPRGTNGKGEGMKLLRFSTGTLPTEIANGHPRVPGVDMEAKGWIFTPVRMAGLR